MTCLSNMSVESVSLLENEMQQVTFLKTPIMATYVSLLFSLFFAACILLLFPAMSNARYVPLHVMTLSLMTFHSTNSSWRG